MAVLLGLLAALTWGTGDFTGGRAARHAPETTVVLLTEAIGLVLLLAIAPFVGGSPTGADLLLGATAGFAGVAGLAVFYRGLADGRASVVAPISAVGAAVLQVTWGLAGGEDPGLLPLVGIVVALCAIGVVAGSATEPVAADAMDRFSEIRHGLLAAVGFGLYLILLSETSHTAGLWTAVATRAAPAIVLFAVLGLTRRPLLVPRTAAPLVAVSGVTDASANVLLLVALRTGLLSIVAPVANLYPAVTILLARLFGHERIGRLRLVGLGLALVSLVLISL